MSKLYYLTANVAVTANGDTWASWVYKFNLMTYDMGTVVVTTDSTTNGSLTTGNAYVNGIFVANTLSALDGIRGGNGSTPANLNLISNTYVANNTFKSDANTLFTNTVYFTNVVNHTANLFVNGGGVTVGNTTQNVYINSSTIVIGNSSVNTTLNTSSFGTITAINANNSTFLNGQPSSYYTNASNITTGTLPIAQLANSGGTANSSTVLYGNGFWATPSAFATPPGGANTNIEFNNSGSFGGVNTFVFNSTGGIVTLGTAAVNAIILSANSTTTTLQVGNNTVLTTINSTAFTGSANNATYFAGQTLATVQSWIAGNAATSFANATSQGYINSTSGTANNANYLGGVPASGYMNTTGSYTITGLHSYNARLYMNDDSYAIIVGNTTTQIITNTTVIAIGNASVNATINSTAFTGSANNTSYLGGIPANIYVNTSGSYSLGGQIIFNSSPIINNQTLIVGNSTVNVTVSTTDVVLPSIASPTSPYSVGFRGAPQTNMGGSAYTAIPKDVGRYIYNSTGAPTLSIANATNVAWPGNNSSIIVGINDSTGNLTITGQTGVTIVWGGVGTTGSRNVGQYGVFTLTNVSVNRWYITGIGIS